MSQGENSGENKTPQELEAEALIAQWEQMAAAEGGGTDASSQDGSHGISQIDIDNLLAADTKSQLNQDEVDLLLSGNEVNANVGIKAMINRALDSYERLPMLEVVFEKFLRLLSASLRNITEDNVDLEIKSIQSLKFGYYITSIPIPALVTIFRAREWEHYGLFVVDSSLIFSLVEILFGGKKNEGPSKVEARPYTTIEQSLVRQLVDIILKDLSESFEALSPVTFKFERMETDPRFASIVRPGDSAVLVKIGVEIEDRKGLIEILFPHDALEPIKHLLVQVFIGEKFGTDIEWQSLLMEKIYTTDLEVSAIIKGRPTFIKDITKLKIGSTILLENGPDDDIDIYCNDEAILSGKLGRVGGKLAISLNESAIEYKLRKEETGD